MSKVVGVMNFDRECKKMLDEYGIEARKVLNDALPEAAKIAVRMLKANSKRRTGKYKNSWAYKQQYVRGVGTSYVVYNRKHYRLTHLLEKDHKVANQYGSYGTTGEGDRKGGDHVILDTENYVDNWLLDEVAKKLGG